MICRALISAVTLFAVVVLWTSSPAPAQPPTCEGAAATIVGTEEADEITGTEGADVIVALGGDDVVDGLGGDDIICGGPGFDVILGGGGDDVLIGGTGGDELRGQIGSDTLRGGGGHDTLGGGSGDDTMTGGPGRDLLTAGPGSDQARGSRGGDTLIGHGGDDTLLGGPGPDEILGKRGSDTIEGGPGKDALAGGSGNDDLAGDRGADALDGGKGDDVLDGGPGRDTCLRGQGATNDTSCLERLKLVEVADLNDRAGLVISPPKDDRLFVVEQYHGIRLIKDGELLDEPFLNLEDEVSTGNEQGVLGLAFHPGYAENGRFFVNYTGRGGNTKVVEYAVLDGEPDRADASSARVVLKIDQPHRWHNGGMLAFGPDGYLYISTGDGGPGDDPDDQGQNKSSLLSALLRIDVDGAEPYAIPPDNPFVGKDGADEIWAYGLRNPWRFSFDEETERLYIGDVGQYVHDEIDVAPMGEGGLNYGWSTVEGVSCFDPAFGCDRTGLTPPTLNLPHVGGACSAIGGFVYRGEAIPELVGHYFWSDFCNRQLNSFILRKGAVTERTPWLTVPSGTGAQGAHDAGGEEPGFVTSLGLDADGELYMATLGGVIYRVEPVR